MFQVTLPRKKQPNILLGQTLHVTIATQRTSNLYYKLLNEKVPLPYFCYQTHVSIFALFYMHSEMTNSLK